MGNLEIVHDVLLAGPDFEACQQRVIRFFDRTMLIHYDRVLVPEDSSVNGADTENFNSRIMEGLAANRAVLTELLSSLRDEGFASLEDLRSLEKGYLSKVLHTIAHLQDGFIGIDSRFYNLEEDSHGVSRELLGKINAAPDSYWILRVKGEISSAGEDPLDSLRTFEREG